MTDSALACLSVEALEEQLNSFDDEARGDALYELAHRVETGAIELPDTKNEVNLHFHTFFSYNAYSWSPSRIAWEARKYGLLAAGIVDFDVLDGMEEFLEACETIGIRSCAAMESRVFVNEYSDKVISSPNEPGIAYFMASGCCEYPAKGTKAAQTLQEMRDMAKRRNLQVVERVNDYLDAVQLDYDDDVLPITPSGNATERHLLAAYDSKAREVFSDNASLATFWADKLGIGEEDAKALLADTPKLHETMRSKLMKFGGVGYVAPTADSFPQIETVIEMIQGMDALPMAAWLDGTSAGEADMPAMLSLLASKGVVALNIVPDRNWNIKNADEKKIKVENLDKVMQAAREVAFPICVGTEMNKLGLPFVDDFSAPELAPYIADFIEGAYFLWGHTFLARAAGLGYASEWANSHFGSNREAKNAFYTKVGRLADPVFGKAGIVGIDLKFTSPGDVIKMLE